MGNIYTLQTKLIFKIRTKVDLTGATQVLLKFKRPDDTTGQWIAAITDAATGRAEYDVQAGDLNQAGEWTFWSHVTYSDGKEVPGEIEKRTIHNEGEV